ncbi:MAG: hypothetical protein ACI81R_000550 [Bradymonadia bacterium]|jgi:hypothetical protein
MIRPLCCCLLSTLVASPAFAQSDVDSTSSSDTAQVHILSPLDETNDDALVRIRVQSTSTMAGMNNRDLRPLEETTVQSIIDSDDRQFFGESDLRLELDFAPSESVHFEAALGVDAAWRDSQVQRRASGQPMQLVLANTTVQHDLGGSVSVSATFGRQRFGIGHAPRDYVLNGLVDGLTGTVDFGDVGALRVLAFDLFSAGADFESGLFAYKSGMEPVTNFRGETNTYRSGAIFENSVVAGLDLAAYWFYATVAGSGIENTGSDVSLGGTTGNFRDRDNLHNYGLRGRYQLPSETLTLDVYGEFAASSGIDRKAPEYVDVDLSGTLFGGGFGVGPRFASGSVTLRGEYYRASGADYSVQSLEFQRGFTSMRGDRVGGLALGRMSSWRPSSVLDAAGFDHSPHDQDRQAGTRFIHLGVDVEAGGFGFNVGYWTYQDTGEASFDQSTLDDFTPPIGFSREEIDAQRRLGRHLGTEWEFAVSQRIAEFAQAHGAFGVFLPGSFYNVEVDRLAGFNDSRTALGGDRPYWSFITSVAFDLTVERDR